MKTAGFLTPSDRIYLRNYMNKRRADGLSVRRATSLIALDKGRSFEDVCDILGIGCYTFRNWLKAYDNHGIKFLDMKDYSQREGHLSFEQERGLTQYLRRSPIRTTDEIRGFISKNYGKDYSRSGCIKLMARLGFCYKKPERLPLQANPQAQQDFIDDYAKLQAGLSDDEAIYFADTVHPEHQARPAYGWFHKDDNPVIPANSGRKRVNIHGALCLENFKLSFVERQRVNACSTIALFKRIEAQNPAKKRIYVILDNARYHKAILVKQWLEQPDCRIHPIWLPSYAPHLNPIERLWGVMHKKVTHNRFYKTYREFAEKILQFFRETIPKEWHDFRDTVTDNFRIITQNDCKIIT